MKSHLLYGLNEPKAWNITLALAHLRRDSDVLSQSIAERSLSELLALPERLNLCALKDERGLKPTAAVLQVQADQARSQGREVLFAQLSPMPDGKPCLHANDESGVRYWVPLAQAREATSIKAAFFALQRLLSRPVSVFLHGDLVPFAELLAGDVDLEFLTLGYPSRLRIPLNSGIAGRRPTPHLQHLEAESIHIIREAVAEAEHPAMLYSIGKDSSVMLHLARKAFYPAPPPFPLVHVDTRWKFREMYLFRDYMARESGMELLVHINPEAIAKEINPFDHGSSLHTDITKTQGLKQVLDEHGFDVVFGGARRDEEKSRAKERVFSFRSDTHRWDPKNQRPELWNLYNTRKRAGESIRVFPLSNWTELDIWQYIYTESIPVVPLYFAERRPVVVRDGMIIMVDDDRMRFLPEERIEFREVRFRTLGCYPLTGAVESDARTLPEIILELIGSRSSERQGRAIDKDAIGSMEKKKQEGYF